MEKWTRFCYLLGLAVLGACSGSQPTDQTTAGTRPTDPTVAAPPAPPADPHLIVPCERFGPVLTTDTEEALAQRLGATTLTRDTLWAEGEPQAMATVLWKGTPQEIEITWAEPAPPFKTIEMITAYHPASPYHYANGIKNGSTLAQIQQLNGRPFKFYGFAWDYGGTFIGFGDGTLAQALPCFGGVIDLPSFEGEVMDELDKGQLLGDHEVSSDHPAFAKYPAHLKGLRMMLQTEE
ncbi:MAG: hypothetical protein MUC97_12840 [Bernardetiaceae bacterium]|jgi:hypothetical protein|nr:hypothetical protein [Bernardetiaceae bacterium]